MFGATSSGEQNTDGVRGEGRGVMWLVGKWFPPLAVGRTKPKAIDALTCRKVCFNGQSCQRSTGFAAQLLQMFAGKDAIKG